MSCNCNNMGSPCMECCGGSGALAAMQTGDDFNVYLVYKEDGIQAQVGEEQNIIMAFYDYSGKRLLVCSIDNGRIGLTEDGYYMASVTHEESMMMVGKVRIELTITDNGMNPTLVDHGDTVPSANFEQRLNNELV